MTITEFISAHPDWQIIRYNDCDTLTREFIFADFSEAFAFMTRVAMIAEQLNHHPNWSNVYNVVTLRLYTHEQQAITDLDMQFAKRVEALLH